jgi:hypothetical protein
MVLGKIDLDPCAPIKPEERMVPTAEYYTVKSNGPAHYWFGKVFVNPPYARGVTSWWVTKLDN